MAHYTKLTARRMEKFIERLKENGGIVSEAANHVKVSRIVLYKKRREDDKFAQQWSDAVEFEGTDVLEDEARRRSLFGVEEPIYYQGMPVGHVRRYSDNLMNLLLKGYRKRFRVERHEHVGAEDGPIRTEVIITLPDNGRVPKGAGSGKRKRRRSTHKK